MDNQHKKIKGYRDLSQYEIDLMNRIKEHAEATKQLTLEVRRHLQKQAQAAVTSNDIDEQDRIFDANPEVFHHEGTMKLQTGFMLLTRAVAQPTSF